MIPKKTFREEAKTQLDKITEIEKMIDTENLVYWTKEKTTDREKLVCQINEYRYTFKDFRTTNTFDRDNYSSTITLKEADEYQSSLLVEIMNFKKKPCIIQTKNKEKKISLKMYMHFLMVEKEFLMLLKAKYFQ